MQSFHPFVLRKLYKLAPRYKRGQLSSFFEQNEISYFKRFIIKKIVAAKILSRKFCKL